MLKLESGMFSDIGPNEENDDCMGIRVPEGNELAVKGVAAVVADGVSAAEAGKQAAEISVQGFLTDYYDSPEAWTASTSGRKVFLALNRWLYGLGQSGTRDGKGYVTTLSAIVFKGKSAHVFHVGDTRVYRWRAGDFKQLTKDHSFRLKGGGAGLARALGMDSRVEVDVFDVSLKEGDRFLLSTDGVHGFLKEDQLCEAVANAKRGAFDACCAGLCQVALSAGSNDNCSAVLLEVLALGVASQSEHERSFRRLPFPPDLSPGMTLDGYRVIRELAATSRSQAYLAEDLASGKQVVLKTPSVNFLDDVSYIERLIMEGWIGRKLDSPHLAKSYSASGEQNFLYTVLEYIEGDSLEDWMKRNRNPDVRRVSELARQILKGLRAMHRQEMIHQDLKPSNVIVHPERGAVIIDFGSTFVSGLQEIYIAEGEDGSVLGTRSYSAPECFLGKRASWRSDIFSLGVIVYEMLTGKLPYGEAYERSQSVRDFSVLRYVPATRWNSHVPVWMDGAIEKAVSINPHARYESLSEFEYDLGHPNPRFLPENAGPFIERHPVTFWRIVAGALAIAQAVSLYLLFRD